MTDGIKRRDFLKVLGVSGAGATMTGCGPGEVEKTSPLCGSARGDHPRCRDLVCDDVRMPQRLRNLGADAGRACGEDRG